MDKQALQNSLDSLITEYMANNPRSGEMFERAKESLPGGNTRTGAYMRPFPIYIERGEGVYFYDLDGHRLLDFVNNNTALILGHAHPAIVEALQDRVAKGTAFSRPTPLEVEMAELLRERVPSLERLRFCSSGTEAVLNALRVARAFTGRRKIARFEGAYHGVGEYALVSYVPPLGPDLGPANRPRSVPSTAGLSPAVLEEVLVLPFNDADACAEIINENADDLAAVIVDPLATGAGTCLPVEGFLSRLRELTTQIGALLIFDEIISFRASPGGAQELYGVRPDLTCMATGAEIINENADDLAAVIVDPLATGAGTCLPVEGFLSRLRELTTQIGALLIFDEIISFRASPGGAQELYGVRPDLTCMAKVVAGGTAGAVFGGRADVMGLYDPTSGAKIPQSGTYNANPIATVAGLVTLQTMTPEAYDKIGALTQRLGAGLESVFAEAGVEAQVTVVGSLFRVHFLPRAPRNYREAAQDDKLLQDYLFFWLLNHGIHWTSGGNVSLPMTEAHINRLVSEVRAAFQQF